MSDFAGMEELLQDFLLESTELLSDVDNKLVELEKRPNDRALLNDIFRGFHTIKGGAGFVNLPAMVSACHLTENLFDALRTGKAQVTPLAIEAALQASGFVADQLTELSNGAAPDSLAFVVRDTGHGIAPERQARLFQPFERLGQENSTIGGAGIGLAISRRLADQTGCRITLDQSSPQGSSFSLHVPVLQRVG